MKAYREDNFMMDSIVYTFVSSDDKFKCVYTVSNALLSSIPVADILKEMKSSVVKTVKDSSPAYLNEVLKFDWSVFLPSPKTFNSSPTVLMHTVPMEVIGTVSINGVVHKINHIEVAGAWQKMDTESAKVAKEARYFAMQLPNATELVEHPLFPLGTKKSLMWTIVNLNDVYKWSKDQIADWLDKLHDDGVLDLSFEKSETIG